MKNCLARQGGLLALGLAALLVGCRSQVEHSTPRSVTDDAHAVDLDAAIAHAHKTQRPVFVLVTQMGHGDADTNARALLDNPTVMATRDRITPILLDLGISRNRATAARFHVTGTPLLVCLSPGGMILSRDESPIAEALVLKRIAEAVKLAPAVDAKLGSFQEAVAENANDATAKLNLADFLLAHHNAREAVPQLAWVAHSQAVAASVRVRAWVAQARAHLWIAEPEKVRHTAMKLIATLGPKTAEATAGGKLVLGLQDANAKRVALARREFEDAITAAPDSVYAKQAAEAVAKLPKEGR